MRVCIHVYVWCMGVYVCVCGVCDVWYVCGVWHVSVYLHVCDV